MIARKEIRFTPDLPKNTALSDEIERTATGERDLEALRKDFTSPRSGIGKPIKLSSRLMKTIRQLFTRVSQQVSEIQHIIWVNPDRTEEETHHLAPKRGHHLRHTVGFFA